MSSNLLNDKPRSQASMLSFCHLQYESDKSWVWRPGNKATQWPREQCTSVNDYRNNVYQWWLSHDLTRSHDPPHCCTPIFDSLQGYDSWGSGCEPPVLMRTHQGTNPPQTASRPSLWSQIPETKWTEEHFTPQSGEHSMLWHHG